MRIATLVASVAAATLLVAPQLALPGPAEVRVPADLTLPRGENSPGQVAFSHRTHLAAGERCSACHMRDLKMKRGASGPVTLEAKQEGRFCGSCHDGATRRGRVVFPIDECDRCHRD